MTSLPQTLPSSFFNRPVLKVANDLIGCLIVRKHNKKTQRYIITETEAYDGEKDRACHTSSGKTKRNLAMFGPSGHVYVYFTYGINWMLNIVTGPVDYPSAVLIRGIKEISGPARLTKKLNITGRLNCKKLGRKIGLWIEKSDIKISKKCIKRTPRIGVDYAGPIWSKKKWRFVLKH